MSNIIDSIQLSGVTYTIQGSGGGKTIEAGRGISVTTGETAYTVSFNLPISAGTGMDSIVEGDSTIASGDCSHAEGFYTQARGYNSHAEGNYTQARGNDSHAEGYGTLANGNCSHAEGYGTIISSNYSHAEGYNTSVDGSYSHAEGYLTLASSIYSHAEGNNTRAINQSEHASGQYNVSNKASYAFGNSGNTLFSVGNGTSNSARHNAFEIRQNGDIYLSSGGTDIKLQDHLGGGNPTVELTQAEYDALVTAGTVSPTTYYIITDATPVDLSQYWTSAQTQSAITLATSGKVDTSTITSSVTSASTNSEIPTAKAVYDAVGSGGGGKAVSAGTNISITTGETADTINCTLPITANTSVRNNDIAIGNDIIGVGDYRRITIGNGNKYQYSNSRTSSSILIATPSSTSSIYNVVKAANCIGIGGNGIEVGYDSINGTGSIAIGYKSKSIINNSLAIGFNTVASGTTKTNINNQLTIDTSNQVYIYNKDNTEMICLQDQLGGGTVDQTIISGSTNAVAGGAVYNKIDEVEQVTAAALNTLNDAFGGLKLMKISQTDYNNLQVKDQNTLYIIVN